MKPEFVTLDPFLVIGIHDIQVPENIVPRMWEKFFTENIVNTIPNLEDSDQYFGIAYDATFEEGSFKQCHYVVGRKVTTLDDVPENLVGLDIPKLKFAKFTHVGSLSKLKDTYDFIYGEWLANCDYEYNPAYELEIYDSRFDMNDPKSEFDIYIPIK